MIPLKTKPEKNNENLVKPRQYHHEVTTYKPQFVIPTFDHVQVEKNLSGLRKREHSSALLHPVGYFTSFCLFSKIISIILIFSYMAKTEIDFFWVVLDIS